MNHSFIFPRDVACGDFKARIVETPGEYLFFCSELTTEILESLCEAMLFALPMEGQLILPNPSQTFCLDLRKDINWFKNSKVRRFASQFKLVIKTNILENLEEARRYHSTRGGTWLTPTLAAQLNHLSMKKRQRVQFYCFCLVELATGNTAACSFGFASGAVFQDYTMYTTCRDKRSCGSILNKVVGHVLQQAGFKLWYWGYELDYMQEYVVGYEAVNVPREAFYRVLDESCQVQIRPSGEIELCKGLEIELEPVDTIT